MFAAASIRVYQPKPFTPAPCLPAPFSAATRSSWAPSCLPAPRMGREEGREPSPQRQEAVQRLERRSSATADGGQQRRRSRSPQRRGSKEERQLHKQRDESKRQPGRSRSRSPPHGGRGDERRSGSGSRPDSGRGGERGASEQQGNQRRGSPDRGRSRRESPGRERSRRDSPDYGDAGPSSRQRGRRSPSPPRARGGWQGDRGDVRGGRGGWQGDRDRRGGGWEGDRDRRGGKDWEGGRGGRGDWGSRGPPDRGGRGRDGGWGGQDGGSERRDPGLGPRFMPRVMQRQHPGEERGAYGRRGERPRSRSPPRHEKAPPPQPAGMVADNPEAAADIGGCWCGEEGGGLFSRWQGERLRQPCFACCSPPLHFPARRWHAVWFDLAHRPVPMLMVCPWHPTPCRASSCCRGVMGSSSEA